MPIINAAHESDLRSPDGAASDFATRNVATAAGVLVGGSAILSGGLLLATALPGHFVVAAGTTGALLYVGDRQFNGKPIIPGRDDRTMPNQMGATDVTTDCVPADGAVV